MHCDYLTILIRGKEERVGETKVKSHPFFLTLGLTVTSHSSCGSAGLRFQDIVQAPSHGTHVGAAEQRRERSAVPLVMS